MIRKSQLLLYCFLILSLHVKAQTPGFLLKHYYNDEIQIGNENWSIREANNGIMYFANSKGVFTYDGVQWKLIKTPQAALSLAVNSKTYKIFVGCRYGFGYISKNQNGTEMYHSLSKEIQDIDDVTNIIINGEEVYFFDNKNIYTANIHTDKIIKILHGSDTEKYNGIIKHQDKVFVNIEGQGLRIISGKSPAGIISDPLIQKNQLLFCIPFLSGISLIGTEDNHLLLFDGVTTKKFKVESQQYLDDNLLASATDISESRICIATMAGGCLLIDKQSGKTESILNYRSGLPDDEILAVEKDNEGGLWMSHSQGISRADLRVSFKTYTNYPGLEGYLISSLNYAGRLYVSTSEGVFYLDKVKTVREEMTVKNHKTEEVKKEINYKNASPKKIFLRNLFRKKEREPTPVEADRKNKEQQIASVTQITPKAQYDTDYFFKKIKNINGKCRQLLAVEDRIMVASNTGLYEISNTDQVRLIIKNEDINTACLSVPANKIFAGTDKALICLFKKNNVWQISNTFKLKGAIYSLLEDKEKNLWIGSTDKVIKLEFNSQGQLVQVKDYLLKGVYNEQVLVSQIHGQICFLVSAGVYNYNPLADLLVMNIQLSERYAHGNFIPGHGKNTWVKSDKSWTSLDASSANKDIVLPLLALFKDINNISTDSEGNLWLIVGNGDIYHVDKQNYSITASRFDLHLREITNDQGIFLTLRNLELDHSNSSINFYFAAPHYLDETSVEYQYMLKGAGNEWSAWTKNSNFKFTLLPSGDYDLLVRARNSLGQISDTELFSFIIHPPYWKTIWFYLAEISFFSLLIILSIIMNRDKNKLFVSKALTFLTLIIVIEFINQYISELININASDNPMMRLGLDVLMALLISPVEKLLKLLISKKKRRMVQMVLFSRRRIKASKELVGKVVKV
jgi:ligand-binding sensor domain-containing protein